MQRVLADAFCFHLTVIISDRRLRACVSVADVADAVTVCVPCEASLQWSFSDALYFAITDIATIGM